MRNQKDKVSNSPHNALKWHGFDVIFDLLFTDKNENTDEKQWMVEISSKISRFVMIVRQL